MRRYEKRLRHRTSHGVQWRRRVILLTLLLAALLVFNGTSVVPLHRLFSGNKRTNGIRIAPTPPELRIEGQEQLHERGPANVVRRIPSSTPSDSAQGGLLRPHRRHNLDALYSTQNCKRMLGEPDAAVEDEHANTPIRVQFFGPHCRSGFYRGGDVDENQRRCGDSAQPIVGLMPHLSAASFFPDEVLTGERGTVGPSSLQSIVEEDEKETRWRTAFMASSCLLCRPRGNESVGEKPNWVWNSGAFLVDISLRTLTAKGELSGGLDANFSFSAAYQMQFFGLPSHATEIRLPDRSNYSLFNQLHLGEIRTLGVGGSGTVPLLYAIGQVPHRDGANATVGWNRRAMGILWINGSPLRVRTSAAGRGGGVGGATTLSFTSTAGATRVYLLPGPTPEDVLLQYYTLTGFPMMPPLFALGYHHTHRGYQKADDLLNVSAAFLHAQIPLDTLGVGLYHANGKRIFTWNRTCFADPVGLQDELWRHGGRFLVLSTVPYVPVDSHFSLYLEGRRHEFFVTEHPETDVMFMGYSESGARVWIDFLDPRARRWYGGLLKYKRFVGSTNHTFFALEENEPFVEGGVMMTLPLNAGHRGAVPHVFIHNMYGMLHAMAAYGGQLQRTHFYRRPFLITQSYFSGTQRYAAVRLGHSTASWDHLRLSLMACLTHGIAGISFVGADVGGFFFQDIDDELLVRWYQLAAFYPLFRTDASERTPFREVWRLAPHVRARIRDAVQFRYALLPYFYTLFWNAHLRGDLILRPLFFVYPQDPLVYVKPTLLNQQFFLGPYLFVAPVLTPLRLGNATHILQMPQEDLYDFWSGELVTAGKTLLLAKNISDSLQSEEAVTPLFQRVGTILPTFTHVNRMRSTHDAANYTLTVTLPSLEMFFSGGGGGSGSTAQLLAQGNLFVDDGSSYIDYHARNTTYHAYCALTLECVLFPSEGDLVLRWSASANSTCSDVHRTLQSTTTGVAGADSFLLTRMRLMFATLTESERVMRVESPVNGHNKTFVVKRSARPLLEVSGMGLPMLVGDRHSNSNGNGAPSQTSAEVHIKLNMTNGARGPGLLRQ
ncbi:putative glycosyl hydrolase-like protein [Trypanosoma rangeli]|uniref:Putative glycosyl hydrolase-like protein n=1 Tax=Trypanosoma rangeli TaxID=5698 RepID=A0A422NT82_TRYRA|nr:putative glycosyl hydrolase-like protein [Trypanosoma rangeli]RNF08639.1 putative glycosyl hydrolase-like protein [Trypanosoma rangeli]|eukprot:RNF08639.1 putative glycosyl hydrolase-like protein [Trypanosoma rangeli]